MVCPFEPAEKQALLEAPDDAERAATLLDAAADGRAEGPRPAGGPARRAETASEASVHGRTTGEASCRRQAPIDPRLLEILVCPLTKGPLEYDRDSRTS